MSSLLALAIAGLGSPEPSVRQAAAEEIYRLGRATAGIAVSEWWSDEDLSRLLDSQKPTITVGLALQRETFNRIRIANGTPRLREVPPDQDAEEFELHFPPDVRLDILTTREPGGSGAIAKYLGRFGEGVQQIEFLCANVDQASEILKEKFKAVPVYPAARPGADGRRVNFFLIDSPDGGKVLIELYQAAPKAES